MWRGGKIGPRSSWKMLRLSFSLWTTPHPSQRMNTLPWAQACGLVSLMLPVPHRLQEKDTCGQGQ